MLYLVDARDATPLVAGLVRPYKIPPSIAVRARRDTIAAVAR